MYGPFLREYQLEFTDRGRKGVYLRLELIEYSSTEIKNLPSEAFVTVSGVTLSSVELQLIEERSAEWIECSTVRLAFVRFIGERYEPATLPGPGVAWTELVKAFFSAFEITDKKHIQWNENVHDDFCKQFGIITYLRDKRKCLLLRSKVR